MFGTAAGARLPTISSTVSALSTMSSSTSSGAGTGAAFFLAQELYLAADTVTRPPETPVTFWHLSS